MGHVPPPLPICRECGAVIWDGHRKECPLPHVEAYVAGRIDVDEFEKELERAFGLATGYVTHFAVDDPYTMHSGKPYGCGRCFPNELERQLDAAKGAK